LFVFSNLNFSFLFRCLCFNVDWVSTELNVFNQLLGTIAAPIMYLEFFLTFLYILFLLYGIKKYALNLYHNALNTISSRICSRTSVAARKLSSKFHAKVSRNFWHESLNLFEKTFPWKFRQNFTRNLAKILHNLHKIEHTAVKIA